VFWVCYQKKNCERRRSRRRVAALHNSRREEEEEEEERRKREVKKKKKKKMGGQLAGIGEHLTLAREYALLGNYDTALIFFEGVLAQINK